MATVSTTLPSDGQTIDAADVNTPINAILSEFNGNIDNDNIKSGAAISGSKLADASVTNAKLSTTAGELGGAWVSYTCTPTNFTVGTGGSAGVTAHYTQIGKTVFFRIRAVLGTSGQSVGSTPTFTLPVTSINYGTTYKYQIGYGVADDAGAFTPLLVNWVSTTTVAPLAHKADSIYVVHNSVTATIPFTWAAGDAIYLTGTYEAA